ncbi:MAG: division/cell wall cluster transcriptional repressor MraZ [Ferruginibacter sp.]
MTGFLGEYESTIDAKGRFLLPVGFKKQLADEEATQFVINRGFEKCLTLFPLQSWNPIFTKLSLLNEFDPKVRDFRRNFLNGATQVEMDSAGRIMLPKNLIGHAGLGKDIVLVSAIDKIEIWDKNTYQQLFESFDANAFSNLANEVMNSKPENPGKG